MSGEQLSSSICADEEQLSGPIAWLAAEKPLNARTQIMNAIRIFIGIYVSTRVIVFQEMLRGIFAARQLVLAGQ